jgi:hypothetical protein
VNGIFPGVTNGIAASQYQLPNGGNLLNGPFTLYGNKAINQAELNHGLLPQGLPLDRWVPIRSRSFRQAIHGRYSSD